jgi:hypothetical protein
MSKAEIEEKKALARDEFGEGAIAYNAGKAEEAEMRFDEARDHFEEARKRFENALSIYGKFWPAAIALAKLDVTEKRHDLALKRLREIRERCDDEIYRKETWTLIYQALRGMNRCEDSLNELRAFRREYRRPPVLPLSEAQPAVQKRDKPYLTPAELQMLAKFEEELVCLMEGRPLPKPQHRKIDYEHFALPETAAEEVAALVKTNLLRNVEGKNLTFPRQPATVLTDAYEGRFFVSIYRKNRDKIVLCGSGETLLSSTMTALRKLNISLPKSADLRFRMDFETKRVKGESPGRINRNFTPGIDGLAVKRGNKEGFVLPGDILESDLQSLSLLQRRLINEVGGGSASALSWNRFQTRAFLVTGLEPGGRMIEIFRGHAVKLDESVKARKKAVSEAADFLLRIQRSDGSWPHLFDAAVGPLGGKRRYSMYDAEIAAFLTEAGAMFGNEEYIKCAERGLSRLADKLRSREEGATKFSYMMDMVNIRGIEVERASLGAAAAACVAFCVHARVTGKEDSLEPAKRLAALISRMQHEDGSFDMFYSPDGSKQVQKLKIYYPGSAALALVKLGAQIDDKEMMESAKKALIFYLPDYGAAKRFDPRLVYAALGLPPKADPESALKTAAFEHAAMFLHLIEKGDGDLAGGIPSAPGKYPVVLPAIVAEACARALTAKSLESTAARHEDALKRIIPFLLRHRIDDISGHYLPNPERAAGAVRDSLTSNLIKSNVIVHWCRALLGSIDAEGSGK